MEASQERRANHWNTRVAAELLRREAQVFTEYLSGSPADEYVIGKYVAAHRATDAFRDDAGRDEWLVAFARRGPFAARLADSHARIFARHSTLLRKLSLVFAILEVTPKYHHAVAGSVAVPFPASWARLALALMSGAITSVTAALIIAPLRLVARNPGRQR